MKKIVRLIICAAIIVFSVALFLFGYYWFVCEKNYEISRFSLSCYVCIKAPIRNFPLIGVVGEPIYGSKLSVSGAGGLFSEDVIFETTENPETIKTAGEEYFLSIGYKKISESRDNNSLSINLMEDGYIYRNSIQNSFILIKVSNAKSAGIYKVYVREAF